MSCYSSWWHGLTAACDYGVSLTFHLMFCLVGQWKYLETLDFYAVLYRGVKVATTRGL